MKIIDLQNLPCAADIHQDDRVLMPWDQAIRKLTGKIYDDPDYFRVRDLLAIEDPAVQQKAKKLMEANSKMLEHEYHQEPLAWPPLLAWLRRNSRILSENRKKTGMHSVSGCNSEKADIR